MIAVDTETTGLEWSRGDYPFLVTISDYDRDWVFNVLEKEGRRRVRDAILEADGLIFHNTSIDVHMLVNAGIISLDEIYARPVHDTHLLAQVVLGEGNRQGKHAGDFKLKTLAAAYVDPDAAKYELAIRERMLSMGLIKRIDQKNSPPGAYLKVWEAYPAIMEEYAMKDTRYTYDLYYILVDMMNENHVKTYEIEKNVQPVIVTMEHKGVALDPPVVNTLREQYARTKAEAEVELLDAFEAAMGEDEVNFDSNRQVAITLLDQGVPLTQTGDNGELRVDKYVLEPFADEHPIIGTMLSHRNAGKFLSTYLDPMFQVRTVHPSFYQIGAWTGRMSCSRPNMQNLPVRGGSELREMFVPREGHAFVVADYSSIELRLLAYYMGSDELWQIIDTQDPFLWLGEQIYGTADQDQWPVKRGPLKNGFYAMTYGAGGPKLASTIGGGMTKEEGRALAKKMKAALGKPYYELNRNIRNAINRRGQVVTLGGRIQRLDPAKAYIGLNALIQGSAADIIKVALTDVAEAVQPYDATPLLVVHDEIKVETPIEHVAHVQMLTESRMVDVADKMRAEGHRLDLAVDSVICYNNYGEAK